MRAVRKRDGGQLQEVPVPAHLTLKPLDIGLVGIWCGRCGAEERVFGLDAGEAALQLGERVRWHRGCPERPQPPLRAARR